MGLRADEAGHRDKARTPNPAAAAGAVRCDLLTAPRRGTIAPRAKARSAQFEPEGRVIVSAGIEEVEGAALDAADEWCRRAVAIARRARRAGDLESVTKANAFDYATAADRAIEAYLRRAIRRRFPDHAVGGEEFGAAPTERPWLWLIDPVDGTFNLVTGLPMYATSIGLLHHGRPKVGAVADLTSGDVFTASSTSGLLRSRGRAAPMKVAVGRLGAARLFLEFGAERLDDWMIAALGVLSATRDTIPRLIGSAAVALAAVALNGGCFVGVGLKTWDVAGGIRLAEASGHVVRWWEDAFPGVHLLVGEREVVKDLEAPVQDLVTQWRDMVGRASA